MSHTILSDHGERRISYQLVRSLSSRIFLYSGDFATSEQSAIFTIGKGVGLKRNVRIRFALSNVLADLRHGAVGAFRYLDVPQIRTCAFDIRNHRGVIKRGRNCRYNREDANEPSFGVNGQLTQFPSHSTSMGKKCGSEASGK